MLDAGLEHTAHVNFWLIAVWSKGLRERLESELKVEMFEQEGNSQLLYSAQTARKDICRFKYMHTCPPLMSQLFAPCSNYFQLNTLFAIFGAQQGLKLGGLGIIHSQCVQSFSCPAKTPLLSSYKIPSLLRTRELGIQFSAPQQTKSGSSPPPCLVPKLKKMNLNRGNRRVRLERRRWTLNGS